MTEFKWTDDLVKEFVRFPHLVGESSKDGLDGDIRLFKEMKAANRDMMQKLMTLSPEATAATWGAEKEERYQRWKEMRQIYNPDRNVDTSIERFLAYEQSSPEWEILEFLHKDGTLDNRAPHLRETNINWWLKDPNWFIHAVRRLSDGEVFRVGEEVGHDGHPDGRGTIGEFQVEINTLHDRRPEMFVKLTKGEAYEWTWLRVLRHVGKEWLTKENRDFLADLGSGKAKLRYTVPDHPGDNSILESASRMHPAANGKVPVWLTPGELEVVEDMIRVYRLEKQNLGEPGRPIPVYLSPASIGKLSRLLALFIDPMAGAVPPPQKQAPDSAGPDLKPAEDRWVKRHFPPAVEPE